MRRRSAASVGNAEDRFAWGDVLFRQGRYKEAITQYRRVTQPKSLAAAAGYRIGRSMVRDGRTSEGVTQLRLVAKRWPSDSSAAQALYLLADLATDDRDDRAARSTFLQVVAAAPGQPAGGRGGVSRGHHRLRRQHVRGGREGVRCIRRAPADKPGGAAGALLGGARLGRHGRHRALRGAVAGGDRARLDVLLRGCGRAPAGHAAVGAGGIARHLRGRARPRQPGAPRRLPRSRHARRRGRAGAGTARAGRGHLIGAPHGRRRPHAPPRAAEPGDFPRAEGAERRCAARRAALPAALSAGISRGTPGRGHARRCRCLAGRGADTAGIALRSRRHVVGRGARD